MGNTPDLTEMMSIMTTFERVGMKLGWLIGFTTAYITREELSPSEKGLVGPKAAVWASLNPHQEAISTKPGRESYARRCFPVRNITPL